MIGHIQRVKLREVWGHESRDFTAWLEENINVLAETTNLKLTSVERECSVGVFSVDLVAEDEDGNVVVIENQLEKSDHDHLGKILTYLVGLQARRAVWIVADPRPEHVGVITWLNESSSADFYLLKLEAIRIGDSEPAALLTQIVGPSESSREIGKAKKEMVEREWQRYRFFEGLLDHAKSKTQLHANISPSKHSFVQAGSGISGVGFVYWVRQHDTRVELWIGTSEGPDKNQSIFQELFLKKAEIEGEFGSPLVWDTKEGRRACGIHKVYATGGWRDEDAWEAIWEELTEAMVKFERALTPHLKRL